MAHGLSDLIYFTEAQWRALVDLLQRLNRESGLFDLPGHGKPVVIYQRDHGPDEGKIIVASEVSFSGEYRIDSNGSVEDPEE